MLGFFLKWLNEGESATFKRVQADDVVHLCEGSAIIAVEDSWRLKQTGLPTGMRYGIITENQKVICQICTQDSFSNPEFQIKELKMADFCPSQWRLFLYELPQTDLPKIHKRARREIGAYYKAMRSYPGDDFVEECLLLDSDAHLKQCKDDKQIGQHWWSPLYYTLEELAQLASDAIGGVDVPRGVTPINPELLHLSHHGILIENDWVIHFSNCRVPDKRNQVKLDTLKAFCNITPNAEEKGGPLKYKKDTDSRRLIHRNRAVWILFHAEWWGKYNLITNNCEHLSRMCKVGRRESAQVKKGSASLLVNVITLFLPGGVLAKTLATMGITYLLNEILNHRIICNFNPNLLFDEDNH